MLSSIKSGSRHMAATRLQQRPTPACRPIRRAHSTQVHATADAATTTPSTTLPALLEQLPRLGKCRFIVIAGAILETVAEFSKCSYTDIPNKGRLATISSPDKTFECHIYLDKVKKARMSCTKARNGDHNIYAIRLLDADDAVLLTCLLHGQEGKYDPAAVSAWEALRQQYGENIMLGQQ